MSEKIFGSETRADEVKEWLRSQGATPTFPLNIEHYIYYVYQGKVRIASKEDVILFDIVELPRWRAEEYTDYYYVSSECRIFRSRELFSEIDDHRYEIGNYFKTKEEAEKYATKFREILKERR